MPIIIAVMKRPIPIKTTPIPDIVQNAFLSSSYVRTFPYPLLYAVTIQPHSPYIRKTARHIVLSRCCAANFVVTIQDLPTQHSHFEHFVFFPAFYKAKNAHIGWGVLFGHLYV